MERPQAPSVSVDGVPSGGFGGVVDLVTVNEAAALMRVSKMTVYRLVRDGALPAVRVGRSFRIYRTDLAAFLHTSSHHTPDPR